MAIDTNLHTQNYMEFIRAFLSGQIKNNGEVYYYIRPSTETFNQSGYSREYQFDVIYSTKRCSISGNTVTFQETPTKHNYYNRIMTTTTNSRSFSDTNMGNAISNCSYKSLAVAPTSLESELSLYDKPNQAIFYIVGFVLVYYFIKLIFPKWR